MIVFYYTRYSQEISRPNFAGAEKMCAGVKKGLIKSKCFLKEVYCNHTNASGRVLEMTRPLAYEFSFSSRRLSRATRAASMTNAENVTSVPRMASSIPWMTSLGKRMDFDVDCGTAGS